jgi:uncharacterized protein YuzE
MKLTVNRDDDALYFRLDEAAAIVDSEEVEPGIVLDFDGQGRVVAIEILSVSTRVPSDQLAHLHFETL